MPGDWVRVNRKDRCPVCGHSDWCTVNPKIGLICCMRIQSPRPARNAMGGWLHRIEQSKSPVARFVRQVEPEPEPSINCKELWRKWRRESPRDICVLADSLGVSRSALASLRVVWSTDHGAWAFPMRDGYGELTGFRLRFDSGRKLSVRGGHEGLFLPWGPVQKTLWITEGASDTAAGLTLGLYTVGRPSCSGGVKHLLDLIRLNSLQRVIIIPDCDDATERTKGFNPGLRGAQTLVEFLKVPSVTLVLPCKDLREFVRGGGTKVLLESQANQLVWTKV